MTTPLLVAIVLANPTTGADHLSKATVEYHAGLELRNDSARARLHFVRAAEAFENLWESGQQTPAVARNMAQARFLAGDIGGAIYNYRRGLIVSPLDLDLRRGLDITREQVSYPMTGDVAHAARPRNPTWLFDWVGISRAWLVVAALSIWAIGCLILARAWLVCRSVFAVLGGGLVLSAIIIGVGVAWKEYRAAKHWMSPTAVVVTAVELRTGNSEEYPKRLDGRLPAGVELQILGERGGWLQVELADGSVGWVSRDSALIMR